jgi:hypothetical protein
MPSAAQRSHAGKKAPNMSKEGAPAAEQPHSDSSGSATKPTPIRRRMIQRCRSARYGSALHHDNAATFIPTLCRAAISRDGCDRRGKTFAPFRSIKACTGTASIACRNLLFSQLRRKAAIALKPDGLDSAGVDCSGRSRFHQIWTHCDKRERRKRGTLYGSRHTAPFRGVQC